MAVKKGFKLTEVGEIPEDWEVKKLDEISSVTSGKRLPKGYELTDKANLHPYIRIVDIVDERISSSSLKYVPEEIFNLIKNYRVFEEDLIITVAGTLGLICKIPYNLDGANLTEEGVNF